MFVTVEKGPARIMMVGLDSAGKSVKSMLLIDPNNIQNHKHVRLSNYPKLDQFQTISLANGLW